MRLFLAITLGLAMAAAATYAALLGWYDGERIRAVVTERMLERHGIVLHIDRLERSFSPRPIIRLNGLRVANADRRDHELIRVETAVFRIHPLSLVAGSLTLDDIVIDGLRFSVPVSDEGALYWDPLVAVASEWLHRFDWSLRHFEIRNLKSETRNVQRDDDFLISAGRIVGTMPHAADLTILATAVDANLETTLPLRLTGTARLDRVELGRQRGDLPVTLAAEGTIGEKALNIEAAGGNLLDGDPLERDSLRGMISLGDAVLRMNGTMSRDDMTHLDLFVTFDQPGEDGDPDLQLEFGVSDPDTDWRFSAIRARRGDSELTGAVEVLNQGDRRFFGGTMTVRDVEYPEAESPAAPAEKTWQDVLPDGDLYANLLDFSRKFDADVRFRAEKSTFLGVLFEHLAVHAVLDRGALSAAIEKASISDADLSATFRVTPAEGQTVLEFKAALRDVPLSALTAGVDDLDGVSGEFDGNINLRATGEESSAVLNSAAGRMVLFLEDGAMPDELATRVAGDVLTAMFADFDKNDTTAIRCAVVDFSVDEGLARSQQMIMDTGAFNLYGRGEIRLGEQNLDIELVPHAKDFSLVSMRLPFRIHGPFDNVRFETDMGEGVASLLTPIELGREDDSNCAPPLLSAVAKE
ncbi:MAG: AsmA family protein [Woeseia sp.]